MMAMYTSLFTTTEDVAGPITGLMHNNTVLLDEGEPDTGSLRNIPSLVYQALRWAYLVEVAPAIGRFLTSFIKSIRIDTAEILLGDLTRISPPVWAQAVHKALRTRPALIEIFEHHILRDLLRLHPTDTIGFARTLPYKVILEGRLRLLSTTEVRLCLLVMKIMEEAGTVSYLGMLDPNCSMPS